MVDDLMNPGAQDRSRVNVHEDYEVRYWTKKWGVSKEQLIAAVQQAGVSAEGRRPSAGESADMSATGAASSGIIDETGRSIGSGSRNQAG